MDERRTYDFMGDNARRFMGLPIANPTPTPSSRGPWRTLDRTPLTQRWTSDSPADDTSVSGW